jgi:hypothetical protein
MSAVAERGDAAGVRATVRWLWSPWTLLVAIAGLGLRWWVLGSTLGFLNADEAYAGLQAMGVLDGRFPVVIDGNVYTAVLECYLFAPLVTWMGGSAVGLKLLFVGVWALAAAVTAGAARRLAGGVAGAVAGAVVWLAPGALMVVSTRAYVGYALGMGIVAATVWAAAVVADRRSADVVSSAVAGGLAGLGAYVHPMYVTVLLPVIGVAAVVHWRDLRRWWLPALTAAVAVNVPFLAWNALNGWPSLTEQDYPPGTWADRLWGFVEGLGPRVVGARATSGDWIYGRSLGLIVYGLVVAGVVAGCVVLVRSGRAPSRWIVPLSLAVSLPAMALLPNLEFVADGRYGVIPFPFLAIALGAVASVAVRSIRGWARSGLVVGGLAVWVAVTVVPFLGHEGGTDRVDANAGVRRIVERLEEVGIDRLAGSYWWVLPIEYASDREIRTAVAGHPFVVRFPESQRLVEQSPADEVAFVFDPGSELTALLRLPAEDYRRERAGGAILYLPPSAAGG